LEKIYEQDSWDLKWYKSDKLPEEYLGAWSYSADLVNCEVVEDFSIGYYEGVLTLSFGAFIGGQDVEFSEEQGHYNLRYKAWSEGESWDASLSLYITNGHLFIANNSLSDDDSEVSKLYSCNKKNDSKIGFTKSKTSFSLYSDLMLEKVGGVFRGVYFNMSKEDVYAIEAARITGDLPKEETDEELIITTDMGEDVNDFGIITYYFDEMGLYSIGVETFIRIGPEATDVFNMTIEHYSEKYGKPVIADDGYSEFAAIDPSKGLKYSIALIEIDDVEEGFGMYLYFDLLEE
jgi:hypothetical protein